MTFSSPVSGTLEVAAALAFHLPGARLDLSSPDGARCSVGPLTDPRCQIHPAEFRELVAGTSIAGSPQSMLGCALDSGTRLSLAAAHGVEHLGGGLYRVASRECVSFTFATTLEASCVETVLSGSSPTQIIESLRDGAPPFEGQDPPSVAINLIQDNGLGVTLVVVCASEISESDFSAAVAHRAMSACLVAEMEQLAAEPDGSAA